MMEFDVGAFEFLHENVNLHLQVTDTNRWHTYIDLVGQLWE